MHNFLSILLTYSNSRLNCANHTQVRLDSDVSPPPSLITLQNRHDYEVYVGSDKGLVSSA